MSATPAARRSKSRANPHRRIPVFLLAAAALLTLAPKLSAHDFWLIPDMFGFPEGSVIHINGRQGTRFPNGTAVRADQIVQARIIGANSDAKITEMSVEGTSLKLHQKPSAIGQYLVIAAVTPRTLRSPAPGFLRFLRAEGAAAEAARLEREKALTGLDTVVYNSATFAATTAQVGNGGPRAFSKTAGLPLEFVPVNDPAHVHVGDTLHVRVVANGKSVPRISLDATPAIDSARTTGSAMMISITADDNGIAHVPLSRSGPWMLRSAYVTRHAPAANELDVARSTYVFAVAEKH
jgi:uncharacterized GH25 family protein